MDVRHPDLPGLGIRQPWAELILRGIKTIEVRGLAVRRRQSIYVYSTREASALPWVRDLAVRHELDLDALPRGVIVGTVEVAGCRSAVPEDAEAACVPEELLTGRLAWELRNPRRISPPCPPWNLPYGMWFRPFKAGRNRSRPGM